MDRAPAHALTLTIRLEGDVVVLDAEGELDMASAPSLTSCVESLAVDPTSSVVIDLGGVTFLDSSGVKALMTAKGAVTGAGGDLSVRNPSPGVARVLEISGLGAALLR